jgi:hypothetical protein
MALRLLFLIQLILGLLFWFGKADGLVPLHMLVGLLFVIVLWYLGVVQGLQRNGSLGLTVGTFLLGLLIAIVGMTQTAILIGGAHWIVQVFHLLLGVSGIGLGEACVARYKRGASEGSPAAQ